MKTQEDFDGQLSNVLRVFKLKQDQLTENTPLSLCSIVVGSQGSNSQWYFFLFFLFFIIIFFF